MSTVQVRALIFLSVVAVILLLEKWRPRRKNGLPKRRINNLFLHGLNILCVRIFFASSGVGVAVWAQYMGVGLGNMYKLDSWLWSLLCILVLDFLIYVQHYLTHCVPILWRLHQVHHTDLEFDLTTAIRFHPVEILLSLVYKSFWIVLLGIPFTSVLIFEAILSSMAIFNHGNFKIALGWDKIMRWFVVTPDMHRVHHSIRPEEYNRNFGFNISLWDRIFKTYTAHPKDGYEKMTIGLSTQREPKDQGLWQLLKLPFL